MYQRLHSVTLLTTLLATLLTTVVSANFANAKEGSGMKAGFSSLFNGKNLDNWVKRGGKATYKIEGNAIVGTSTLNTSNTFLCTKRDYADYILEVELKVDDGLNSGIQIRSHCFGKPTTVEIKNKKGEFETKTIPAGRVHGYQVEIDPSDRAFSGGIYDEARRGWLQNPAGDENQAARAAFKRGEWNKYRIEAIGPSIKTWINGVPISDLTDDMDAAGLIALQVHGIGDHKELAGTQVRWRNIHIKEMTKPK